MEDQVDLLQIDDGGDGTAGTWRASGREEFLRLLAHCPDEGSTSLCCSSGCAIKMLGSLPTCLLVHGEYKAGFLGIFAHKKKENLSTRVN